MKVTVEMDCTPEEARQFLGLPDLKPMQDRVMTRMEQRMLDAVSAGTPDAVLKAWFPFANGMPEQFQKMVEGFLRAPGRTGEP